MPQLESRLFLVTDRHQTIGRPLVPLLQRVLTAGAPAIQLRERDLSAKELVTLAREVQAVMASRRSQLLINDRVDVALALDRGANVDAREAFLVGRTPLMIAASRADLPIVRLLLHRGADPTLSDEEGQTAVFWARTNWDYGDTIARELEAAISGKKRP